MNRVFSSIRIFGILLFLWSSSANAILISFEPASQNVALGNAFNVDLVISGLGAMTAPSLGAYSFDVTFDSSRLGFNSAIFGNQLDLFGLGSITSIDDSVAGVVSLFELSLDLASELEAMQLPEFTLVTLTFDTLASGSSDLGITNIILSDALGYQLFTDANSSTITVSEPGYFILFITGFIGLFFQVPKYRITRESRKNMSFVTSLYKYFS